MRFFLHALPCLFGLALASPVPTEDLGKRELVRKNTPLNEFITLLLEYLPAVDATIASLVGVLTDFEVLLVDVTGEQDTYNGLGGPCTEYTLIFARGTTEPGNVGILVGPPLITAIRNIVGSSALTVQGVNNYGATVDGYLEGGDPAGSAEMAKEIQQAYAACPNTKLIASGYSQGGQLVHNAAAQLPAAVAQWISSAVIFGDPDNGTAVANVPASKTDVYCHVGDDICLNGDLVLPAHLTYAENVAAAAAFITSH
jgi:cutinase